MLAVDLFTVITQEMLMKEHLPIGSLVEVKDIEVFDANPEQNGVETHLRASGMLIVVGVEWERDTPLYILCSHPIQISSSNDRLLASLCPFIFATWGILGECINPVEGSDPVPLRWNSAEDFLVAKYGVSIANTIARAFVAAMEK